MKVQEVKQSLETAFIDGTINSNLAYQPEFISNDYKRGKKVLVSLEKELKKCDEFFISVAFIKLSGITPLLMILKELEKKGIPGKIITTDYQLFTEPKALDKLASLKNISLKIYCCDSPKDGFHTKGYIFREDELYRIIIGSSFMELVKAGTRPYHQFFLLPAHTLKLRQAVNTQQRAVFPLPLPNLD